MRPSGGPKRKDNAMQRLRIIGLIFVLLVLSGCAAIQVVDEGGRPIPNHVVRGSIPATDMQVDFALARYYGQPEGDEFLDTHEYLNPYGENIVKEEHLRSLVLMVQLQNPKKQFYKFVLYYDQPETIRDVLYEGNLSRKEFNIFLPAERGMKYVTRFELQAQEDFVFFRSPVIRYEVEKGKPVTKLSHDENTK
jgi:hypothetical protein